MTPGNPVKGVPPGVVFVEFKSGSAADNEFELVDGKILKGPRPGAASAFLVVPAEGYTFQPMFDIGLYKEVFVPAKQIPPLGISATLNVIVTNSMELDFVKSQIEELRKLPGFTGLVISPENYEPKV